MNMETQPAETTADHSGYLLRGERLEKLPDDLYIPPDALEVILEAFEGPLDLLLYLIRKQNLDIIDIPVAMIARQYIQYIELMRDMKIELAGEYLLMATMLAEIKSRMLLPRPSSEDEDEGNDPRAELVRRLQEYERFKTAAEDLDEMPRIERDIHPAKAVPDKVEIQEALPQPELRELLYAFREVMLRAELFTHHQIAREPLTVRERMGRVLDKLQNGPSTLAALFDPGEGRLGVVVTFLALLELAKGAMVQLKQSDAYGELEVRMAGAGRFEELETDFDD